MKQLGFIILLIFGTYIQISAQDEPVFLIVQEQPRFPGCEELETKNEKETCSSEKMIEYIYSNLKYPAQEVEKQTVGQAVVQFVVGKDGTLKDIELIRGINEACDAEALRLVESMNTMSERWIPGKQRGELVNVKFTLPIKFKVEKTPKTKKEVVASTTTTDGEEIKEILKNRSPRFSGCEDIKGSLYELENCSSRKMLKFIYGNLKYPAEARNERIEGQVIIQFVITVDGYLENITALSKVSGGCTEEALLVVNAMNDLPERWIPGMRDGEIVDMKYTLPVKFRLE